MKEEQIIAGFIRTAIRNPSKRITVKEISSESKINRTYFYQFFDSEEDIAIETAFSLISAFINRIFPSFFCLNCVNRSAVEKGVQDLIVHKEILEALLLEQPNHIFVLINLQNKIKTHIETKLMHITLIDQHKKDFFSEIFSVSLLNMINWIIKYECMPPIEIAEIIAKYLSNSINALFTDIKN